MKFTKYFAALTIALLSSLPAVANVSDDTTRMAEKIRKKIVTLGNYGPFDNIGFSIDGSKVTPTPLATI